MHYVSHAYTLQLHDNLPVTSTAAYLSTADMPTYQYSKNAVVADDPLPSMQQLQITSHTHRTTLAPRASE